MDSARVNGPSPLPRHVRRVYPTGERFLQNSSRVKRVLVERYFFFFPIPRRITPIIPLGLLDWSNDWETCRFLYLYVENISRVIKNKVYIIAVSSDLTLERKRGSWFIQRLVLILLDWCLPAISDKRCKYIYREMCRFAFIHVCWEDSWKFELSRITYIRYSWRDTIEEKTDDLDLFNSLYFYVIDVYLQHTMKSGVYRETNRFAFIHWKVT